ncbi:MAG: class I SAM-dependent methyltransferase [Myxococcota bacterium]|nr:class I SAM-dependent methyltransferase [Myxococcota bacterium]
MQSSVDASYAERLRKGEAVWWKRLVDVQLPYRLHLRRLELGFVLDVGCGLGRNLTNLGGAAAGVGVDPNPDAIATCRERGLVAFTPDELAVSEYAGPERFDTLLISHVLEHLPADAAAALIARYLPSIKHGGRAVFITPQEAGFRSDPTHLEFVDLARLAQLATAAGLTTVSAYSFPFPRPVGRWFRYNEFVVIARKP